MRGKTLLLLLTASAVLVWIVLPSPVGFSEENRADAEASRPVDKIASNGESVSEVANSKNLGRSNDMRSHGKRHGSSQRSSQAGQGTPIGGNAVRPGSPAAQKRAVTVLAAQRKEAIAQLREGLRRDHEGLVVETMPDGSKFLDLQGRFQHVTSLVETAEGEMVPMCSGVLPPEFETGEQ